MPKNPPTTSRRSTSWRWLHISASRIWLNWAYSTWARYARGPLQDWVPAWQVFPSAAVPTEDSNAVPPTTLSYLYFRVTVAVLWRTTDNWSALSRTPVLAHWVFRLSTPAFTTTSTGSNESCHCPEMYHHFRLRRRFVPFLHKICLPCAQ